MNSTKRVFYYDALRAMAIIGIVFCHVSVYFLSFGFNSPGFSSVAFLDCLRDFSIPIFVMLSGALLIGRDESFKVFFKKRLSRLLIPFLFWAAVYIIYSCSYTLENIISIFFGHTGSLGVIFWFVWMMIMMYIGIFVINKIISFTGKSAIYVLTVLSLIYFISIRFGFDPYSPMIVYFASFITYIIIGYFISSNDFIGSRVDGRILTIFTLAVSVLLYCYYILCFVVPKSQANGIFVSLGYFTPLLFILSVNVFIFFKYLDRTRVMDRIESGRIGDVISVISRYSFGIYLVHYLIIDFLKLNVLSYIPHFNTFFEIILIVIFTLIISLALLYIFDRIPFLNRFSGTH